MGRTDEQKSIVLLTQKVMHSYFEENRLDTLFGAMAEDIIWVGPAKPMRAEGRVKVQEYFRQRESSLFMCKLSDEFMVTKQLGQDYWLVEVVYDVQADEAELLAVHACYRATFVYRRTETCKFEIVHLHLSIARSKLAENELLAKQAAAKLHKRFMEFPDISDKEKIIITMLRQGMTNREIAEEMGLAEITIKKALSRMFRRYGVSNRTGLLTCFLPPIE